MPAPVSSAR